jgi:hypothetical protein
VYATLPTVSGQPVRGREVTARLVTIRDGVPDPRNGYRLLPLYGGTRGGDREFATSARTRTDNAGRWELPLIPQSEIADTYGVTDSYYLVREWGIGERVIIVPPSTDPRVVDGAISANDCDPQLTRSVLVARAELAVPNGVATLGSDGKLTTAQRPASGGGGGPLAYRHTQGIAATVWLITHGLGYDPAGIHVVDHLGTIHHPAVSYPTANTTIRFDFLASTRGTADLS